MDELVVDEMPEVKCTKEEFALLPAWGMRRGEKQTFFERAS